MNPRPYGCNSVDLPLCHGLLSAEANFIFFLRKINQGQGRDVRRLTALMEILKWNTGNLSSNYLFFLCAMEQH